MKLVGYVHTHSRLFF